MLKPRVDKGIYNPHKLLSLIDKSKASPSIHNTVYRPPVRLLISNVFALSFIKVPVLTVGLMTCLSKVVMNLLFDGGKWGKDFKPIEISVLELICSFDLLF